MNTAQLTRCIKWGTLCLLLTIVAVPATTILAADPNWHQIVVNGVNDIEGDIHQWDRAGSLALSATILIGIIGLVVTGLQAVQSGWSKVITAALGILSGGLVVVNQNYFDADHRAYRSLANQSRLLVRDFKMQLALYPDPLRGRTSKICLPSW